MRQKDVMLQPTPPAPPQINGYLKKLKRKTMSIAGNWNKRWFFVDSRRREFGYADSQSSALRSSIYLDDITAVVQFDDTHFQVESRTRNFFLWGESKASTSCWVTSLEGYRKKVIEYEKDKIAYAAATATCGPQALAATATAGNDNSKPVVPSSRHSRESVKTTASLTIQSKQENGIYSPANRSSSKNEQRNASPLARDDLSSSNGNQSRNSMASDREKRNRDHHRARERSRDRDRESKHDCKHKREPSDDRDRSRDRVKTSNGDRDRNARALDSGRAAVMQAWVDDS